MPKKTLTFATSAEKKDAILKLKETLRLRKEELSKLRSFLKEKEALHAKTVKETKKAIAESEAAHIKATASLAETQDATVLVDGRTKAAKGNATTQVIKPAKKSATATATATQ